MFTSQTTGLYWFSATIGVNTSAIFTDNNGTSCFFLVNGEYEYLEIVPFMALGTASFELALEEGVQISIGHCDDTRLIANSATTHFSGMLIRTFDEID